jgi:hypothetical protein
LTAQECARAIHVSKELLLWPTRESRIRLSRAPALRGSEIHPLRHVKIIHHLNRQQFSTYRQSRRVDFTCYNVDTSGLKASLKTLGRAWASAAGQDRNVPHTIAWVCFRRSHFEINGDGWENKTKGLGDLVRANEFLHRILYDTTDKLDALRRGQLPRRHNKLGPPIGAESKLLAYRKRAGNGDLPFTAGSSVFMAYRDPLMNNFLNF